MKPYASRDQVGPMVREWICSLRPWSHSIQTRGITTPNHPLFPCFLWLYFLYLLDWQRGFTLVSLCPTPTSGVSSSMELFCRISRLRRTNERPIVSRYSSSVLLSFSSSRSRRDCRPVAVSDQSSRWYSPACSVWMCSVSSGIAPNVLEQSGNGHSCVLAELSLMERSINRLGKVLAGPSGPSSKFLPSYVASLTVDTRRGALRCQESPPSISSLTGYGFTGSSTRCDSRGTDGLVTTGACDKATIRNVDLVLFGL